MKVAIIPARGGSQRISRKNIRSFMGEPIIAYSIRAARRARVFDWIVVSTNSSEIMRVARSYGVQVLCRPDELSIDEVGTQAVAGYTIFQLAYQEDLRFAHACVIYPCAPLMRAADLVLGYETLKRCPDRDYCYTIDGQTMKDAGQWYWGNAMAFLRAVPLQDPHVVRFPLPPSLVCDINTYEDWTEAERKYREAKEANLVDRDT